MREFHSAAPFVVWNACVRALRKSLKIGVNDKVHRLFFVVVLKKHGVVFPFGRKADMLSVEHGTIFQVFFLRDCR